MIVSLYLSTTAWLERFFRIVKACFDGVWLGVLSRERLHAIDASYYHREKRYADEESIRPGLWPWAQATLDRFFVGCARVVMTGAGAVARSSPCVSSATTPSGSNATLSSPPLATGSWPARATRGGSHGAPGPCDGVIVGWGSSMLIQGAHRVEYVRGPRASGRRSPCRFSRVAERRSLCESWPRSGAPCEGFEAKLP